MNIEEDRNGILYDVNKMIRDIECPPVSYRVSEEDALILLKEIYSYLINHEQDENRLTFDDIDRTDAIDSINEAIDSLNDAKDILEELEK